MRNLFGSWSKNHAANTREEFLEKMNVIFKDFLINYSCYAYLFVGFTISCCMFYYILDCRKRMELKRRRMELQRASERLPQQRRPGAAFRDHEIFRNALKTARRYMKPLNNDLPKRRSYTLRRTRSGAVYGTYTDETRNRN